MDGHNKSAVSSSSSSSSEANSASDAQQAAAGAPYPTQHPPSSREHRERSSSVGTGNSMTLYGSTSSRGQHPGATDNSIRPVVYNKSSHPAQGDMSSAPVMSPINSQATNTSAGQQQRTPRAVNIRGDISPSHDAEHKAAAYHHPLSTAHSDTPPTSADTNTTAADELNGPNNKHSKAPGSMPLDDIRKEPYATLSSGLVTPTGSDIDDARHDADEFDWSDDEERREEERRREQQHARAEALARRRARQSRWHIFAPYHVLRFLATTFLGNFVICLLLLAPGLALRFAYAPERVDPRRVFVSDNVEAWFYWASFNIAVAWGIHFLGELVPKVFLLAVDIIWGQVTEQLRARIEVYNAAKGWLKPIFVAAFVWGSWAIIFTNIYGLRSGSDPATASRAQYTYRVYQVIELLFFIVLIFSVEKIVTVFVSLHFHQVAYADRIKEVNFALSVLDKLKDYKPKRKAAPPAYRRTHSAGYVPTWKSSSPPSTFGHATGAAAGSHLRSGFDEFGNPAQSSEMRRDGTHDRSAQSMPSNWKRNQQTPPKFRSEKEAESIPMTPQGSSSRQGAVPPTTTAGLDAPPRTRRRRRLANFLRRRQGNLTSLARQAMKDPISTLSSETTLFAYATPREARKLARKLFFAFRDPARNYLVESDFFPAFVTVQEARDAFAVFDVDHNGDISRDEIKNTVMRFYKERRLLARGMQDVGQVVSRLDACFMFVCVLVVFFIALSVFQIDIGSLITSFYTLAIGLAFIFQNMASNIFDSIIFIFVTHAIDTGDRIFLDDDTFVVKRVTLLSTLLSRWDGTDIYVDNYTLARKFVINVRRSGKMFENAWIQVGWDTSVDKLERLEAKMNKWLQTEQTRMFEPSTMVVPQSLNYMRYIECTVGMMHRENWQDWGGRWNRRNAFHAALHHYTRELGITYYNSLQPVAYTGGQSLDEALHPPAYDDDASSASESERAAAADDGDDEYDNDDGGSVRSSPSRRGRRRGGGDEQQQPATIASGVEYYGFIPYENLDANVRRRKGNKKAVAAAEGGG